MTLGVVLAGGRGERLGLDRPKAMLELAGRTLLARALGTLGTLCDSVRVSAPAGLELDVDRALRLDDPAGAAGPLAGLVAALSLPCERLVVLAVDLPFATAEALGALAAEARPGDEAVLPAPHGIPQPLAAWYVPGAGAALAASLAAGERSVTRAVLALRARVVLPAVLAAMPGGEAAYDNLNTPSDLESAKRRCREGAA